MKKSAILLLACIIFFGSCDNAPKSSEDAQANLAQQKQDADNLNTSLKELDVPSQVFKAPGGEVSLIRGKKGTAIFLSPGDLETEDGEAPGSNIIVELKELTTQAELARANAQTVSNGGLLVSGGAYYINMTSDGKKLKLKKDRTLKVAFPKITDSAMMLYYGERDSNGQMNWQPTNEPLTSKQGYSIDTEDTSSDKSIMVYDSRTLKLMGYVGNDSTYKRDTATLNKIRKEEMVRRQQEEVLKNIRDSIAREKQKQFIKASKKLNESLYDIVNLKTMYWTNIDNKFSSTTLTDITYTIDPKDSITVAKIYMIYKDILAMVNTDYFNKVNGSTNHFVGIPVGFKARLLAVTHRKGELLACKMDMTVVPNQHTLIIWKKVTSAELNSYFDVKNGWGQ